MDKKKCLCIVEMSGKQLVGKPLFTNLYYK